MATGSGRVSAPSQGWGGGEHVAGPCGEASDRAADHLSSKTGKTEIIGHEHAPMHTNCWSGDEQSAEIEVAVLAWSSWQVCIPVVTHWLLTCSFSPQERPPLTFLLPILNLFLALRGFHCNSWPFLDQRCLKEKTKVELALWHNRLNCHLWHQF